MYVNSWDFLLDLHVSRKARFLFIALVLYYVYHLKALDITADHNDGAYYCNCDHDTEILFKNIFLEA